MKDWVPACTGASSGQNRPSSLEAKEAVMMGTMGRWVPTFRAIQRQTSNRITLSRYMLDKTPLE
jgi:hypothetical protein